MLLTVAACVVAFNVVGALWYTESTFLGLKLKHMNRSPVPYTAPPYAMLICQIGNIMVATVLTYLYRTHLGVFSVGAALHQAFYLSVFVAGHRLHHEAWTGVRLIPYLIDTGHDLVCLLVVSVLIAVLP